MVIATSQENASAVSEDLWPEFTHDMCDVLNEKRCLVVVASLRKAEWVCRCVDRVCSELQAAKCENEDRRVAEVLTSLPHVTRVRFTTDTNIRELQKCTAVYGRVPLLAVLEMYEDRLFALDLIDSAQSNDETMEEEAIVSFLRGFARGTVPKALQGAAPPVDDRFEPVRGLSLLHGLCAVTSTFERLKRGAQGGAVCVFWGEHCTVCTAVLAMVDRVVGLVWKAAERRGVDRPFRYVACDVDNNDLPEADWPGVPQRQVVPTVVAYNGDGDRFVYNDKRTVVPLVRFVCQHCLPTSLTNAAQITSDAMASAEDLQGDGLWGVDF